MDSVLGDIYSVLYSLIRVPSDYEDPEKKTPDMKMKGGVPGAEGSKLREKAGKCGRGGKRESNSNYLGKHHKENCYSVCLSGNELTRRQKIPVPNRSPKLPYASEFQSLTRW